MSVVAVLITLRKILIRSGFEPQKAESLKEYFEMDRELDAVIPYPELKNIKKELSANKKYMEMLRKVSLSRKEAVYRYFRQEGMLEEKIGIVDSGWTGTTQKSVGAAQEWKATILDCMRHRRDVIRRNIILFIFRRRKRS